MKKTMESACNELLAECPASRAVIRALVILRSLVNHPDLAAGDDDIKLAALHVEDAIWALVGALQGDK
jgi:hypothetical protein